MLKNRQKYQGYLLFESSLSLVLVTLIIIQIVPLLLFLRHQQKAAQANLEVYRFFNELAVAHRVHGRLPLQEKESNGVQMTATPIYQAGQLKGFTITSEGETSEIVLQEE